MLFLFQLIISFLITYLIIYLIIPILKRKILDLPNLRSSHLIPTPRGGGIAFISIGLIGAIFNGHIKLLLILPLAVTGLIDDIFNLNAKLRYFIQFSTAWLFYYYLHIIIIW